MDNNQEDSLNDQIKSTIHDVLRAAGDNLAWPALLDTVAQLHNYEISAERILASIPENYCSEHDSLVRLPDKQQVPLKGRTLSDCNIQNDVEQHIDSRTRSDYSIQKSTYGLMNSECYFLSADSEMVGD